MFSEGNSLSAGGRISQSTGDKKLCRCCAAGTALGFSCLSLFSCRSLTMVYIMSKEFGIRKYRLKSLSQQKNQCVHCRTSLVLNFDDIRLRRGFITPVLDGASTSSSSSFSIASICLDCFRGYGTILGPDDLLRCLSADIVDEVIMFV